KMLIGCPGCGTWLHEECIVQDIKEKVLERGRLPPPAAEVPEEVPDVEKEEEEEQESITDTIAVTKAPVHRKGSAKGKPLLQSTVNNYSLTAAKSPTVPNSRTTRKKRGIIKPDPA